MQPPTSQSEGLLERLTIRTLHVADIELPPSVERLRAGWLSRHRELCPFPHGWRDSFPGVRDGWASAGGRAPAR